MMRKSKILNFLIVLGASLLIKNSLAQQPYIPVFAQTEPDWKHALYNPLHVTTSGIFDLDAYSSVGFANHLEIIGNYLFLISTISANNAAICGFIISKINIETGEILWSDIVYDPMAEDIGYFSIPNKIHLRKDGNIEFLAHRKMEIPGLNNYDMSYRMVYDINTGERLGMYFDKTNLVKFDRVGSTNGVFIPVEEDSVYLHLYLHSEGFPEAKRALAAALVTGNCDNFTLLDKIFIDPGKPTNFSTFRTIRQRMVNDSIFVILANLDFLDQGYNGENKLYFFNYSDMENIRLVRTVDISDMAIYDPRGHLGLLMEVHDGELVIMDTYYDQLVEQRQFNYFLKMDDQGTVLNYIAKIKPSDNSYYSQYLPILVTDSISLFWAWSSIKTNKRDGFDLVTMDQNNEIEYIASLYPKEGSLNDAFFPKRTLLHDNKLILEGTYELAPSSGRFTRYIMSFDMDELKKGSITNVQDEPVKLDFDIVAFPNPTLDQIYLKGLKEKAVIEIFNQKGERYPTILKDANILEMTNFPEGVYFVKIIVENSVQTLRVIKQ